MTASILLLAPTRAAAADFPVETRSFQANLPEHRRCARQSGPKMPIIGATQIQEWCDPANRDRLQMDLFVKAANGGKGRYLVSGVDFSCATERPQIPGPNGSRPSVESAMCP